MVTVLLATFNGEKYLEAQLQSLVNQTYSDLKIVIRDDGSTDGTQQIIDRYAEIYRDKIEVCPTLASTGSEAGNFFKLLEEYSDDYIMLCSQDDIWLPEKVEKTLFAMREAENSFSADAPMLVHTDLYLTDEKLQKISDSYTKYCRLTPEKTQFQNVLMQNNIMGNTVMINRALKDKLFSFPRTPCHGWWLGLIAAAFGKVIYLNFPTVLHRRRVNSDFIANLKTEIKVTCAHAEFLNNNYAELLSIKQRKTLQAVIDLPTLSLIKRIKAVKKYGLHRNSLLKDILSIL